MPSLGADMEAGELVEWLVKPGDTVSRGDVVAVVETAKGAIDVEIYQSGTVLELVIPVGTKVPVGTVLARLDGPDDPEEAGPTLATPGPDGESHLPPLPPAVSMGPSGGSRVRVVPRARRRAAELGIDLAAVRGSGTNGVVSVEDVERAAGAGTTGGLDMRGAIAATMSRSNREIPHYHLSHAIDLHAAMAWMTAANEGRSVKERLLPVALLVRATALALRKHPELNGHWLDGVLRPAARVVLGMAVSLRGGGLVAPVIPDATELSVYETMTALQGLIGRARSGSLRSSDMAPATATITNLGDLGVDVVHGVIHPPQVALIGFGAITEQAWVVDGAVVPRRVVQVSLSADHRATDGHQGGKLLLAIDKLLQKPEAL
jgi:pyruvate dehydrogenase E2 component (dihydrolipoamide acetyltransferase)